MPIPPSGHFAERGDRTHLFRLVAPVLSQRASPAGRWGSRESNAERAPYQRAQVTVPSYPCVPVRAPGIEPGRDVYKTSWPDQGHARRIWYRRGDSNPH